MGWRCLPSTCYHLCYLDFLASGYSMGGQTLQALTVQYRSSPLPWQIFDLPGTMITWEWGIVFACLVVYVALVESWKAVKRAMGWGAALSKEAERLNIRAEKIEGGMGTNGTASPV